MSNTKTLDLSDWVPPEAIAQEYPNIPLPTIKYLTRKSVRETNGFDWCVRFLTPRKPLISRSRFPIWLSKQTKSGSHKAAQPE